MKLNISSLAVINFGKKLLSQMKTSIEKTKHPDDPILAYYRLNGRYGKQLFLHTAMRQLFLRLQHAR
jgi:hypothetical protein